MASKSAGIVLYRLKEGMPEVFLIHMGGPYWAKKDEGAWSIPKGEFTEEEPWDAAKREFQEETGFQISGDYIELSPIKQSGGKVVYAFAVEGSVDATRIQSNTFIMEWPPKSGKMEEFPEADKAAWFTLAEGEKKILKSQLPLLKELEKIVNK